MKYFVSLTFILILSVQSCSAGEEESENVDQIEEIESADSLKVDSTSETLIDADIASYEDLENFGSTAEPELTSLDRFLEGYRAIKSDLNQSQKERSYFTYVGIMELIALKKYWFWGEFDEAETTAQYGAYGLNMAGGEGEYSLMVDSSVPGEIFKNDITDEVYQYSQLGKINGRQFTADAGIIISFAELGTVLLDAEERLIANYDSFYYSEFYSTYYDLLEYMMYGAENTDLFIAYIYSIF